MRRTFITVLATAALVTPALAAPNLPKYQPQQPQAQADQQTQQPQAQTNQQASNQQSVSPSSLSSDEIKEMQSALNKDGFNVGRTDGKWGPRTRQALQKFEQSKGIQSRNGQLTEATLAQLGVNTNQQGQNPSQPQNGTSH